MRFGRTAMAPPANLQLLVLLRQEIEQQAIVWAPVDAVT
jgi:hypothetical protein